MWRDADEKLVAACRNAEARERAIRKAERSRIWNTAWAFGTFVGFTSLHTFTPESHSYLRAIFLLGTALLMIESARLTADLRLLRFASLLDAGAARQAPRSDSSARPPPPSEEP